MKYALATIPVMYYLVDDIDGGDVFETRDLSEAVLKLAEWRARYQDQHNTVRLSAVIDE